MYLLRGVYAYFCLKKSFLPYFFSSRLGVVESEIIIPCFFRCLKKSLVGKIGWIVGKHSEKNTQEKVILWMS
jgi:hypothetical protein